MVQKYKKKTDKKRTYGYSKKENMNAAIEAVKKGMSNGKAAKKFNVEKSTLHDRVNKKHTKKSR